MKQATSNRYITVKKVKLMGKRIYNIIGCLVIAGMVGHAYYSIYHLASFDILKFYIGTVSIVVFGLPVAGLSEWIYNKHHSMEWDQERIQFRKYISKKMIHDIALPVFFISIGCLPAVIL